MTKDIINIAYTIRNESYISTLTSIYSLIENNSMNLLKIYIIYDENFDTKLFKYFKDLKKFDNLKDLIFVKAKSDKYFFLKKYIQYYEYINEHFYIFELDELLEENRIIFLNSSTIINGNLEDLYNINMEGKSCAVVEHIHSETFLQRIDTKRDIAFNNAVMLIDLKIWKQKKYLDIFSNDLEKFLSNKKQNIYELDLFNELIQDFKTIDLKYNYTEDYSSRSLACSLKTKSAYKKLLLHVEKPIIITYIGPETEGHTPFSNSYINLWWKYAKQTPIYNKIKEYKDSDKYKLSTTSAQNSFKYSWLLSRIFPYIKPYWFRILLGFAIAIPLGLLDGVTAFALKPYMDYVVGGKALELSYNGVGISITSMQMAFILPICVVLFAAIQGVLRYSNEYLSAWTSAHITNDVKFDLFHRLIHMHPQFFDENSSGIVISRYMGDPGAASAGIVDNIKTITTSLCGALGLIAVMLYSSWKLALIGVLE